jgi:hypothetical protein
MECLARPGIVVRSMDTAGMVSCIVRRDVSLPLGSVVEEQNPGLW